MKYPGGKTRELKHICPATPDNVNRYFEPFVGGGAVYFSMTNFHSYHINDKSPELINTYLSIQMQDQLFFNTLSMINEEWKKIDDYGESYNKRNIRQFVQQLEFITKHELVGYMMSYFEKMSTKKKNYIEKNYIKSSAEINQLYKTVLKSSYYATIRELYNKNRANKMFMENAALYYYIREFCYSSMFRFSANGNFNVPYGGMSYNRKNLDDKLFYITSQRLIQRLQETEIHNKDFENFLNCYDLTENDYIFLDPPYDTEFSTYDGNEFSRSEQIRLANFLHTTNAKWMLVIKDTGFIRSLYNIDNENIYYYEFGKEYSVSFMNRNEKKVNHLLITNYEV